MHPIELLALVRRGFAAATREQVRLVRSCLEVEVVGDEWVPRWALEAEVALAGAGYDAARRAAVFARGRGAVFAELESLVRSGRRSRILEPRGRWSPLPLDLRTHASLLLALTRHREACGSCAGDEPCFQAEELVEEIDLLFPLDRRHGTRAKQVLRPAV